MNINFYDFSNTTKIQGTVPHITFNNLNGIDFIKHGFSTRLGGVSKGIYSSMNLSLQGAMMKKPCPKILR